MKKIICWAALMLALCLPVCALAATEPNAKTIEDTTTYEGDTIKITIDQWCYAFNRTNLRFFVANVYVSDPAQMQTAFAGEQYSKNNAEATSASISAAQQMIFFINDSFGHAWRVSAPLKWEPQLAHISKLGLNRRIKKFSYSFICGKGYSPPFGGRIAFCLQSAAPLKREPFGYGVLERLGQRPASFPFTAPQT